MAVWLAVSTQYTNVIDRHQLAIQRTTAQAALMHAEMAHIEGCIVLRLAKTYNVI